jgi:DNA-directed RNA polymerase subunit RPC12/RpoP
MENPNASQTTLDQMTAKVRAFPCASCGAKFSFAPGTKSLKCPYCGAANEIAESDDSVEELDLEAWLDKLVAEHETHAQEQVKCSNCSAEQTLPANLYASACTFCGTPITSKSYAQRLIKPKSLVPFKVTKLQAQDKWRAWIKGMWMAPSALKQFAQSDGGIKGMYIPYWTFDANTYSSYSGARGDNYSENYETTNSNGERVTQTRTQTRWTNVSGTVSFFHDDVLVPASSTYSAGGKTTVTAQSAQARQALAQIPGGFGTALGSTLMGAFSNELRTWNTKELVPYQEEYITGFQAEAYQVSLKEGFAQGRQIIDAKVRSLVEQDIGGDHQRISNLNTDYTHLTFKHILLPVWMSAYIFKGKTYRFMVNGQTGEVQGESPKSGWKIFFLVVGILVLLFIFLAVFGKHR